MLPQLSACKNERQRARATGKRELCLHNPDFKETGTCQPCGSISRSRVLKIHFPFWAQIDTEYNNVLGYPRLGANHDRSGLLFFMVKELYLLCLGKDAPTGFGQVTMTSQQSWTW